MAVGNGERTARDSRLRCGRTAPGSTRRVERERIDLRESLDARIEDAVARVEGEALDPFVRVRRDGQVGADVPFPDEGAVGYVDLVDVVVLHVRPVGAGVESLSTGSC